MVCLSYFFHNYNWLCKASYNWGSHLLGSLAWGTLFVETTAFYSILIWGPGQRHHRFKVITYSDRLIEFWVLNHPTNWVFLSSKDSSRCLSLKPPASGENAMDTSKKTNKTQLCRTLREKTRLELNSLNLNGGPPNNTPSPKVVFIPRLLGFLESQPGGW